MMLNDIMVSALYEKIVGKVFGQHSAWHNGRSRYTPARQKLTATFGFGDGVQIFIEDTSRLRRVYKLDAYVRPISAYWKAHIIATIDAITEAIPGADICISPGIFDEHPLHPFEATGNHVFFFRMWFEVFVIGYDFTLASMASQEGYTLRDLADVANWKEKPIAMYGNEGQE